MLEMTIKLHYLVVSNTTRNLNKFIKIMIFENISKSEQSTSSNSSHDAMKKKALELEEKNTQIENLPQGQLRDEEILKLNALNEELNRLEIFTGISEKEIMDTYEQLTEELAKKSIDHLLKEINKSINKEDSESLKNDINNGQFDKFLNAVKTLIPKQLLLATACSLMITTSAWAIDTTQEQQMEDSTAKDYQISQQIKADINASFSNENNETNDTESIEKTNQLMSTANQKAKEVIDNIEGPASLSLVPKFFKKAGIKQIAQKGVIDELADNSQAIIEYLNNSTQETPSLNDEALELFNIYKNVIAEVDKFESTKASTKIRSDIESKLRLIATKNYTRITKEMS